MKFLSKEELLERFSKRNTTTFTDFLNKAMVKTSKQILPLKDYIKNKDINIQSLKVNYD